MYLFIDTETGGLDPVQHSLLTFACDLVPEIGADPIAKFSASIKHPVYHVDATALRINGINLAEHDAIATDTTVVTDMFSKWFSVYKKPFISIQPVGWNIPFDLSFIFAQLFSKQQWRRLGIDYHALDVCVLVEFLIIQKKLPPMRRLVDVAGHFALDISKAHDADYDNYLCRNVLSKLLEL